MDKKIFITKFYRNGAVRALVNLAFIQYVFKYSIQGSHFTCNVALHIHIGTLENQKRTQVK